MTTTAAVLSIVASALAIIVLVIELVRLKKH
jgi:hypothetical protein